MKTTAKQFRQFQDSFCSWRKELGCVDYKATFIHEYIDGAFADIEFIHSGKACIVRLTSDVKDPVDAGCFNPADHGKHEAIHLFLSRLTSLAHSRYVMEREIDDADEAMTRVLEKLL